MKKTKEIQKSKRNQPKAPECDLVFVGVDVGFTLS